MPNIELSQNRVGHLYCAGRLGDRAVDVLVDTGAASTVVDREVAEQAGLTLTPLSQTGGGAGAASLPLWLVGGAHFRIGEVSITEVPLIAMEFEHIRAALIAKGAEPPQAVLGGDVMRGRRGVIDYGSMRLFIESAA